MSKETLRPEYYNTDSVYEPIKIIQHYGLCFEIANNLKYCLRAGVKNKDTEIEDLIKAKTYLQLRIDFLESQKNQNFKKGGEAMQPLKVWNGSDAKKPISEDELAIEKFMDLNKQDKEDQFKPFKSEFNESEKKQWHDDVSHKLISELKVGDEIKAINPCTMYDHGVIELMGDALIVGNNYKIKNIYNEKLDIRSQVYDVHTFDFYDLHEYFHVSKE